MLSYCLLKGDLIVMQFLDQLEAQLLLYDQHLSHSWSYSVKNKMFLAKHSFNFTLSILFLLLLLPPSGSFFFYELLIKLLSWIDSEADLNSSYNKIQKEKNAHFSQTIYKIHYNNFCISLSTWEVQCLNQRCSKVTLKVKFLAQPGKKNAWTIPNWNRHS